MRPLAAFGLVVALLATGCLSSSVPEAPAAADAPAPRLAAADFLASLELPVKPDAKRATTELDAFVTTVAPLRHSSQATHLVARDVLEKAFQDAGLSTWRHNFTAQNLLGGGVDVPGQNVLGVLPGKQEKSVIILGGHYDGAESAIGAAYDDGSGTLIVVELARALAQYSWNHTLVFAAWDYEESGLVGSDAFVAWLRENDYDVALYMNFDMVGVNWPAKIFGARDQPLGAGFGGPRDAEYAELWANVTAFLGYPAEMTPVRTGVTGGGSDHVPFIRSDYPAVAFEGAPPIVYPFYHNADTFSSMVASVGGLREDLDAGFDAVLQGAFLFTFLVDAAPDTPADVIVFDA